MPSEIIAFVQHKLGFFQEHMWLYLSIPFISGFIGWITKVVAVQMMFAPLEFFGFKILGLPIGWQGIVPRKAQKMATTAVELMTSKLIKPEEIFARLDPKRIAKEIELPIMASAEDITREVAQQYQPGLWEGMPEFARKKLIRSVQAKAPEIVEHIMSEVQKDVPKYFDIKHMVINNLMRDKRLLNEIFKKVGKQEFRFFSNVGFVFGFAIGILQMVVWILTEGAYPWLLPAFGGLVGFISDWTGLYLLFRPLVPKNVLGYTWQGLFIKRQKEVAADYAALISKQLLTSRNMMEELFTGVNSDRVIALVSRHVKEVIDVQAGVVRPIMVYAIGGEKYQAIKEQVAERILEQLPETMKHIESYAEDAMDIRNTLVSRMQQLTPEEFEGMLRPAFKEDEWSLIIVGAVLGFLVGEMQVHVMLPENHQKPVVAQVVQATPATAQPTPAVH